jgi:hypothetical protein
MGEMSLFSGDRDSHINPEQSRTTKNPYCIPQFLQKNIMLVSQTSSLPLHLILIPIHNSSILMSFNDVFCEISGFYKGIDGAQFPRDVTPCLLVNSYWRCRVSRCLHILSQAVFYLLFLWPFLTSSGTANCTVSCHRINNGQNNNIV